MKHDLQQGFTTSRKCKSTKVYIIMGYKIKPGWSQTRTCAPPCSRPTLTQPAKRAGHLDDVMDNNEDDIGVSDTLSDSIQCLNFAKKLFILYSIQYYFTKDSIQNIIQLKKNSVDSIQKIIQFNSQDIIDTGQIGKVPKNCKVKVDQKGGFSSKMANIDSKHDSFIHFKKKFNLKDYSISFFSGTFNSKKNH